MKSDFTLDDLILFAYNETRETNEPEKGDVMESEEFRHDFREMLADDNEGKGRCVLPDKRVINNIMNYSRALSVVRTRKAGYFNLLMN